MNFKVLAQYYEKLEGTSKRLELIDILSKLFREAKSDEIGKICYLIQGRVAPFFEPIELGMAENMVAQAVGKAFGKTKDEVIKLYRAKGNMGIATSQLANSKLKTQNSKLSVSDVFQNFLKLQTLVGKVVSTKK